MGIIEQVKRKLTTAFQMVKMRPISFYVGAKVKTNREKRTLQLL